MATMSGRSDDDEDTVEMRCQKCGYKWEYSGELWNTTCPRCNNKTKTPLHPEEDGPEDHRHNQE